jgi:2-aminoethylphosphonate-pyruvate transaminase
MLLLIPGPVTTHPEVRAAMSRDFAPWDDGFRGFCAALRLKVMALAGVGPDTHSAMPLQGCGHFAMEAAIRSLLPQASGRLLVPLTGSYAVRMARLARECGRQVVELPIIQTAPIDPALVAAALAADPAVTHVGLVYSETSTGVVHDPAAVGRVVREAGRKLIVDAVSAFGALPLALSAQPEIDAAVFTSNKCLEGMPGLSWTLARDDALERAEPAGSWSFDLGDLYRHMDSHGPGSFRFTPPAQVLAAFDVALDLHRAEGGQPARLARYAANAAALYDGMLRIGLTPNLPRAVQGPIVLNVCAPDDPAWGLPAFVEALKAEGYVISNFFDTPNPTFRIGCIGQVTPDDMRRFSDAVDRVLTALGVRNRAPARQAA